MCCFSSISSHLPFATCFDFLGKTRSLVLSVKYTSDLSDFLWCHLTYSISDPLADILVWPREQAVSSSSVTDSVTLDTLLLWYPCPRPPTPHPACLHFSAWKLGVTEICSIFRTSWEWNDMFHEVRIKVLGKKALYKNGWKNFSWGGGHNSEFRSTQAFVTCGRRHEFTGCGDRYSLPVCIYTKVSGSKW